MKRNYENMSNEAIEDLYAEVFDEPFGVQWGDHGDHRREMIECIETGNKQATNIRPHLTGAPGIDYVL